MWLSAVCGCRCLLAKQHRPSHRSLYMMPADKTTQCALHTLVISVYTRYMVEDSRSVQNTRSHKSVVHFAEMIIIILLRNKFVFIFHAYTTHTHPFCHLPPSRVSRQKHIPAHPYIAYNIQRVCA